MTKFNQAIKIFISCWIALLFTGCNTADNETVNENEMSTPIFEGGSEIVETGDDTVIYEVMWDDLDDNGQKEYIKVTNTENGVLEVFFNGQVIYEHVEIQERIVGIGEKEFVDLDGDGKEEIFISFQPSVNSMPLVEWFVLKQTEYGWKRLEMYYEGDDMLNNAFPISVFLKEKEYLFYIICEEYVEEIVYDATRHYANEELEKEDGDMSFDFFKSQNYEVGDQVGCTSDWGIWNIVVGAYEGQNCLIAEHGLNGMAGRDDYLGQVYVYFNYDTAGQISILNMTFEESNLYYLEQKESNSVNE